MKSNILVLIVLLSSTFLAIATELNLYLYTGVSSSLNLVCNDGSPAGYYYRPAKNQNSNKWIVHLQGGYWCWDAYECSNRMNQLWKQWLTTSDVYPPTVDVKGIFEQPSSSFFDPDDTNLVWMPYCSSDAWLADTNNTVLVYGKATNVQFRGRQILNYTLNKLLGTKTNQQILLSGCSAGGRGAMVMLDHLQDILPKSFKIRGLIDSAAWEDIPPYGDFKYFKTSFSLTTMYAFDYFHPVVSSYCSSKFSDQEQWKCIFGSYAMPLLHTPYQAIIFQYDSFQLSTNFNSIPISSWTDDMNYYANVTFRQNINSTAYNVYNSGNNAVHSAACYQHCMTESTTFQDISVNGVTAQTQLEQWFILDDDELSSYKQSFKAISQCDYINCDYCPTSTQGQIKQKKLNEQEL